MGRGGLGGRKQKVGTCNWTAQHDYEGLGADTRTIREDQYWGTSQGLLHRGASPSAPPCLCLSRRGQASQCGAQASSPTLRWKQHSQDHRHLDTLGIATYKPSELWPGAYWCWAPMCTPVNMDKIPVLQGWCQGWKGQCTQTPAEPPAPQLLPATGRAGKGDGGGTSQASGALTNLQGTLPCSHVVLLYYEGLKPRRPRSG